MTKIREKILCLNDAHIIIGQNISLHDKFLFSMIERVRQMLQRKTYPDFLSFKSREKAGLIHDYV